MQPAQGQGVESGGGLRLDAGLVLDPGLVHRRAAQEAGLVVGVVLDHLQGRAHGPAVVAGELRQQRVAVVELGAVVAAGVKLLDVRALEVAGLDGRAHLGERRLDAFEVEVLVLEQAHGRRSRSAATKRRFCRPGAAADHGTVSTKVTPAPVAIKLATSWVMAGRVNCLALPAKARANAAPIAA